MSEPWAVIASWIDPHLDVATSSLLLLVSVATAGHALLHKRNARPAAMWVAVCLLLPGVGALVYWLFGYNRISTRVNALRGAWPERLEPKTNGEVASAHRPFAEIGARITGQPMRPGHALALLRNAEGAYPAMLRAIEAARTRIYLSTYIFDRDADGLAFVVALRDAVARGVDVRVLVDGLGEWYSPRRIGRPLRKAGVPVERFLPASILPPSLHLNLRYHRKLLVIDGVRGFTGGMNIGSRHRVNGRIGVRDLHFSIEGPAVREMERQFLEDWAFATGTQDGAPANPDDEATSLALSADADSWVRAVSSGPNEDLENIRWILLGALSQARRKIRIMTPYFIAEPALVAALNSAALRGVEVELVLPGHNNLIYMNWAADAQLWQILSFGVRVFRQPAPFDHTKLVLIDDEYALVGSSNLDPRSLRLNFEFNLEVCGGSFLTTLSAHYAEAKAASHEITAGELEARPLWIRLRDAIAALFSPYL